MGVPQGSPIFPLYSNIYLNLLDKVWHKRGTRRTGSFAARYADDAILVCRKSAEQALEAFAAIASRMGTDDQSRKDPDHEADRRV